MKLWILYSHLFLGASSFHVSWVSHSTPEERKVKNYNETSRQITIVGQLGFDKRGDNSNVPSITQNLNPILSPTQVVVRNLSIGLECCVSFVNQPAHKTLVFSQQKANRNEGGGAYLT